MKVMSLSNVKTLNDLKRIALCIDNQHPLLIKWPFEKTPTSISFYNFENYVGTYNFHNDVISFVDKCAQYTLPCFESAWRAIYDSTLSLNVNVYVPLSYTGEYPVEQRQRQKWERLKAAGVMQRYYDEYDMCEKYSTCRKIEPIPENILKLCSEIEISGTAISSCRGQFTLYPYIIYGEIKRFLGHYNCVGNLCIFVNYDGRTYYSFNSLVIDEVFSLGYIRDPRITFPESAYNLVY